LRFEICHRGHSFNCKRVWCLLSSSGLRGSNPLKWKNLSGCVVDQATAVGVHSEIVLVQVPVGHVHAGIAHERGVGVVATGTTRDQPFAVVDDEDCHLAARVVLAEGLGENLGVTQIVAGDDRADPHGHGQSTSRGRSHGALKRTGRVGGPNRPFVVNGCSG
jgi:hypothetical protein